MDAASLLRRLVRHVSVSDLQPKRFATHWPADYRHSRVLHQSGGGPAGNGCRHAFIRRGAGQRSESLVKCGMRKTESRDQKFLGRFGGAVGVCVVVALGHDEQLLSWIALDGALE